jgi:hypothetical protein
METSLEDAQNPDAAEGICMIPIPHRMTHLRRDRRGYPIPWGVFVDGAGHPHFQINDEGKRQRALLDELCPVCGAKLTRGRWFVGGPMSAFHPDGAYADPPMHFECMTYSMLACPYLAAPRYGNRIDDRTLDKNNRPPVLLADFTSIPRRPPLFVAVLATAQKLTAAVQPNVVPCKPYLRIIYWRQGVKLDTKEGDAIVAGDRAEWDKLIANRLNDVRLL